MLTVSSGGHTTPPPVKRKRTNTKKKPRAARTLTPTEEKTRDTFEQILHNTDLLRCIVMHNVGAVTWARLTCTCKFLRDFLYSDRDVLRAAALYHGELEEQLFAALLCMRPEDMQHLPKWRRWPSPNYPWLYDFNALNRVLKYDITHKPQLPSTDPMHERTNRIRLFGTDITVERRRCNRNKAARQKRFAEAYRDEMPTKTTHFQQEEQAHWEFQQGLERGDQTALALNSWMHKPAPEARARLHTQTEKPATEHDMRIQLAHSLPSDDPDRATCSGG
tara:strand:- start:588 stop:1418 length:831 start_codon:yes stop_codon:yes gene_type:complete